jgi:hypothetical protein
MNLLKTAGTHKSFAIVLLSTSASIRNHEAREYDFTNGPPVDSSTGMTGYAEKKKCIAKPKYLVRSGKAISASNLMRKRGMVELHLGLCCFIWPVWGTVNNN